MPLSRLVFVLSLVLVALVGCTPSAPAAESPTGSAWLATSLPQALSAADVTRVKVTVSASDMPSVAVELGKSNGSWGGLLSFLPVGTGRTFLAQAYDASGTVRFQGQASGVSLSANQTTAVALTLQEVSPPPPYANEAPLIESLVASSTSVQTGASLSLTSSARDPNAGDTLTLAWTATAGSFSSPSGGSTSWTAPATTGLQTLTLTVTDSQGVAVSVSLVVNVVEGASGKAALDISFNLWPTVSRVSSSLNRLDAGQSTAVSVLAADADNDRLTYAWTATCAGTWTNATSASASFVPSSVPAGACNNCQLTVAVQDVRGGKTTGTLALCVAAANTARFPPRFSNAYQSASTVGAGQTVTFDVSALDPQSSTLVFSWSATTGTLAAPTSSASASRVVWTAPACAIEDLTPGITATVSNAFGLKATQGFEVTLPRCATGWATTQTMSSARANQTATLLPGGKVLVVGGYNGSAYVGTAEVYDPATGTWSATGSRSSALGYQTATLLPNGKVLVSGGYNGSAYVGTAEVYDPATGTWSATASMSTARGHQTATLLPNGKVLVAGGHNSVSGYLGTAEVYDPATGTWSATAPMSTARGVQTATLLPNGKVLVAGGFTGDYLRTAEVYDPATGTWSATAPMSTARGHQTATLLPNGKVLIAGGYNSNGYVGTAEVYDPAAGTWSTTGPPSTARGHHAATLLSNGQVLVVGGANSSVLMASAEVYDPATGTWSVTNSMSTARSYQTATLLPNGKVLVPGGLSSGGAYVATAEVYSP